MGRSNRLAAEQSPYLQQHANQPVDWWPWCDDAFAEAERRGCPVLISIGYATCHWCHVMAHESFDDPAIAELLNQHYVCIKVDREERPDVDAFYMDVCQAMTGHGGWPLTVMSDAQRRPFFTGTYFPPESRSGRIGFGELLTRVHHAWVHDRQQIDASAAQIIQTLQQGAEESYRGAMPESVFAAVAEHHRATFDATYGGFRTKPKFPSPHHLLLLFRIGVRSNDTELLRMATSTLDAMRAGGIYDHVGGGIHRYSTDQQWLLPHFEKMLYDQAMTMMAYVEAWQLTGRELYRTTVLDIADYVERNLTSPTGAFLCAQDADSEGVEGKYYVWSYEELRTLLSEEDVQWMAEHFGVCPDGNMHDEATGSPLPANILHIPCTVETEAGELARTILDERWQRIRHTLEDVRRRRIPPLTDDKVLTDWNGLMIGALARAGRTFSAQRLVDLAERAFADVQRCCGGEGGRSWVHRYRNGHRAVPAMLDDHAAIGWASVELYHTTGQASYLHDATWHADEILREFAGETLVMTSARNTDVPVRRKEGFDSAYPCGNSMAAWLLADLGATLNDQRYTDAAHAAVTSYAAMMERMAPGFCMLLCVWDRLMCGTTEIRLCGAPNDPFLIEAGRYLGGLFAPNAVLVWQNSADGNLPQVQVCRNGVCQLPVSTIEELYHLDVTIL